MKNRIIPVLLCVLCALFASCKDKNGGIYKPSCAGAPYDVLVVADAPVLSGVAGKAVIDVLHSEVIGVAQVEPSFTVSKVTSDRLNSTKFCRSIVMVNVSDIYTEPKMKYSRNVYARDQIVLTLQAPTQESLANFARDNERTIVDFLTRVELAREAKFLRERYNTHVDQTVEKMFGCHICLPVDFAKYKEAKDFFWAATDRKNDKDMYFVMYTYPYTDPNTFTKEYFVHKRDSVLKENVPGPNAGQYMKTAEYVRVYDSSLGDEYVFLARGLWNMQNYHMGGPFVSMSRVDVRNNRVIVVEGFVYAPEHDKRDMIRMMESALYTLSMPEYNQDGEQEVIEIELENIDIVEESI